MSFPSVVVRGGGAWRASSSRQECMTPYTVGQDCNSALYGRGPQGDRRDTRGTQPMRVCAVPRAGTPWAGASPWPRLIPRDAPGCAGAREIDGARGVPRGTPGAIPRASGSGAGSVTRNGEVSERSAGEDPEREVAESESPAEAGPCLLETTHRRSRTRQRCDRSTQHLRGKQARCHIGLRPIAAVVSSPDVTKARVGPGLRRNYPGPLPSPKSPLMYHAAIVQDAQLTRRLQGPASP